MKYEIKGNDIILHEPSVNLAQTLDCGQAFRWTRNSDNGYSGYYVDKYLEVCEQDDEIIFKNTSEKDFLSVWASYFDLERDYEQLKSIYSSDPTLKAACEYSPAIRLLKQDSWECLVSYIFSQHNNIPRIKGIISRLCEHYGHFPTAGELFRETPESLGYLRSGFRAKYVIDGANKVYNGEVDLDKCQNLPYEEAKAELMKIKGVGPKVADCVLLYGFAKVEAWPVDVWIKRVMQTYYPNGLPKCVIGTQGIAQLYLFNYVRNLQDE